MSAVDSKLPVADLWHFSAVGHERMDRMSSVSV